MPNCNQCWTAQQDSKLAAEVIQPGLCEFWKNVHECMTGLKSDAQRSSTSTTGGPAGGLFSGESSGRLQGRPKSPACDRGRVCRCERRAQRVAEVHAALRAEAPSPEARMGALLEARSALTAEGAAAMGAALQLIDREIDLLDR